MATIVARGKLVFGDFYRLHATLLLRRFRILAVVAVLVIVPLPFLYRTDDPSHLPIVYIAIFLLGFWALISLLVTLLTARALVNNPLYKEPVEFRYSDDGIDSVTSRSSAHFDWSLVVKAIETKEYFYLWLSKTSVQLLPKRLLDEDGIPALRRLIRERVSGTVRLRGNPGR